jgi:hypothetical protein
MLSSFQGSAADACVYNMTCFTNFTIPPGKVSYHGVRYHLAEWGHANQVYVAVS